MSHRTGIELTEFDVPADKRAAWRLAKAERSERIALKNDLNKREIAIPPHIPTFDLAALRAFHAHAENTPEGRYAAIRRRHMEGKTAKFEKNDFLAGHETRLPYKD